MYAAERSRQSEEHESDSFCKVPDSAFREHFVACALEDGHHLAYTEATNMCQHHNASEL